MTDMTEPLSESDTAIFECGRIIQNPVLLRSDYIPPKIIGRNEEIGNVAHLLKPTFSGAPPENAIIYGLPGTGKTVVVRYVLKIYQKHLVEKGIENILPVYVNCRSGGAMGVAYHILQAIDPETTIPQKGMATHDYVDATFKIMKEKKLSIIVIFDEIDGMKSDELLYVFTRARAHGDLPEELFVASIGLSNDAYYMDTLDPRVLSSFGRRKVVFPRYNATQIQNILDARVELGAFFPDAIDDGVIPLCSAYSARDEGDARKAIELLHAAGKLAERQGEDKVKEDHVRRALDEVEEEAVTGIVKTLPPQAKIILYSIILEIEKNILNGTGSSTTTGETMMRYQAVAADLEMDTVRRTRSSQVITELDMIGVINTRLKVTHRGKTRGISLQVPISQIKPLVDPYYDSEQPVNNL